MSGSHSLHRKTAADFNCHSIAGEVDASTVNRKNICHDLSHLSHHPERASDVQSLPSCDGLHTVSEDCQLPPEVLNLKMCNGIDCVVGVSEAAVQIDGSKRGCIMNSDIPEQFDQQLNIASKPSVIEDRDSCTAVVDLCLPNSHEVVSSSDYCIGPLVRSNSFTETSSFDQLPVPCVAARKLADSPKPVLKRHSMTYSRTKKQVTIETDAQVIEIDTGTSECPEIESEYIASQDGRELDCTMVGENEFSWTVSEPGNSQVEPSLFSVSEEVSRNNLTVMNMPFSAEKLSVTYDSATSLQEIPVSSKRDDSNASDTDTSPSHAVELTAARCRSYEVKCRCLVEDDDDSCGDEADDESTANEEELEPGCKEEREHKRKRRKSVEDEIEKVVTSSPNGRFLKFDWEIGCGSFKTVYKGLDSETGVHIAWCELQVCICTFIY